MLFHATNAFAADQSTNLIIPKGSLVYLGERNIKEINLQAFKTKTIYDFFSFKADGLKIRAFKNHSFLISLNLTTKYAIAKFNLPKKEFKIILDGFDPVYLQKSDTIVYFGLSGFLNTINSSFKSSSKKKVSKGEIMEGSVQIMPVSDQKVIFIQDDSSNNNKVWSYDSKTKDVKLLPIHGCTLPQVWRDKTKQLMCYDRAKEQYFLTGLDGKNVQHLKTPKSFLPIVYVPEYDELFFNVNTIQMSKACVEKYKYSYKRMFCAVEIGNLGIYNFTTGKYKIVKKGLDLGVGQAVYIPNGR